MRLPCGAGPLSLFVRWLNDSLSLIGGCVFVGRRRTAEPTVTSDRWFLSVCYPKANLITPKQFQQVNANYEVAQATYQSLMDQMGYEARLANTRARQAKQQAEAAVRAAQERLRILGVKPDGTEPEVADGKVVGVRPDGTLPASERAEAAAQKPETILPPAEATGKLAVKP